MEFVDRTVPANFNLFLFGDVHIGTLLHYGKGFDKFIDMLNSPYGDVKHNVAIGMGDYIEAVDHSDKRFDVESVDLGKIRPDQQMDHFVSKIESSYKKLIVLLEGNHEWTLKKYHNYTKEACKKLNVPYGTYSAVTTFLKKQTKTQTLKPIFKSYTTHGNGSISSVADSPRRVETNMNLSLERKLKQKMADCAIAAMGHTHKLLVAKPTEQLYLTSDEKEMHHHYTKSDPTAEYIPPDHRWYVNTGSFLRLFLKGISGYAERAMYDPIQMGFAVARIRDCEIQGVDKVYV